MNAIDQAIQQDPTIAQAVEELADAAQQRANGKPVSKQSRFTDPQTFFASLYKWLRKADDEEPPYSVDSTTRDTWLRGFWHQETHLEGVINSVVAIDKNRGWNLTGGRNQVARYNNILREVEGGAGWRFFASRASMSFYTADMGAVTEVARDGMNGPAAGLFNTDPCNCQLSGNPAKPLYYYDLNAKLQEWEPMDFFRTVPLPSNDQAMHGLGWCAVSRVTELAKIMLGVYHHDQEMLLARAPRGLLLLQNITEDQWLNAMRIRDVYASQKEQQYFSAIDVIAQMGSEAPDAKLFALSQLPANFDIEVMTRLLMYSYALCLGYDPIEFWPVMAGALGRGRETDIQHRKGTSKGAMDFILTMQDGLQRELPSALLFQFEERDVEGEIKDAQVHEAWAKVAALLGNILSKEQLYEYLADKGVIPTEWTPAEEDVNADAEGSDPDNQLPINETENADDEGEQRAMKGRSKGAQRLRRQFEEKVLSSERVRRACVEFPQEPIVRSHFPSGKLELIWHRGEEAMKRRSWAVPDVEIMHRQVHRPRVVRAEAETLFDEDGVTITTADVEQAIGGGAERVGRRFGELLEAEPAESSGE